MSFYDEISKYNWSEVKDFIYSRKEPDVLNAINKNALSLEDFAALLSPAAEKFLEPMAKESHRITLQRFGKTIKIYIPMYVSNECVNSCVYCGFNVHNKFKRKTLTLDEVKLELDVIKKTGIKHILICSGEHPKKVSVDYLNEVVKLARKDFSSIIIEVQPLDENEYRILYNSGADSLALYQETYNKDTYKEVHLGGKKTDYRYRLEAPERAAAAGLRTIGIGALMGLDDFRVEEFFVGLHARYLMRKFWKTHITVSFPRIRDAEGHFKPTYLINDKNLVQSMLSLRLFLHDVGLVISTREPAELRDKLIYLGVTQMSAGSKTNPGGYAAGEEEGKQFEVEDTRSAEEFIESVRKKGFDPVLKDWDSSFINAV
ncbi:2-iminoacetate synthase ThiH [Deferribacterales bacterium Es71-Z0220]|jgi:2-iminoacetate synthase|uniref:2-iminoacetate synthase ThiH n=1 Tax=Deferrivibrio essentukiensis TaxID=2880922 RepID=UPI001F6149C3|nr:2-iminoacetate synthase ThiH [Deferrivibrio essentukiensis]MCB4203927.1 2-iminoacetate synthase ThiH [Deferrivibrio essentukiensis]